MPFRRGLYLRVSNNIITNSCLSKRALIRGKVSGAWAPPGVHVPGFYAEWHTTEMEHLSGLLFEIKNVYNPPPVVFHALYLWLAIFPPAKCFPSIRKPLTHCALYCFLMRHSDSGKAIPLASADVRPATSITVKTPLCPKTTFLVPKIWTLLTGADTTVRGSLCTQWTMVPVPSPHSAASSATDWCESN